MNLDDAAIDAAAAGAAATKAAGASWAGAAASVLGWVTQIDLLTLVGVLVAVSGALVSWYYQHQRTRLARAESEIRQRNLLLDEQIKKQKLAEMEARITSHAERMCDEP